MKQCKCVTKLYDKVTPLYDRYRQLQNQLQKLFYSEPHHSEPYDVLAAFYEQLGDMEKHLQFALLAAHLDYRCPADKWISLATLALEQGKREQAINCYSQGMFAKENGIKAERN